MALTLAGLWLEDPRADASWIEGLVVDAAAAVAVAAWTAAAGDGVVYSVWTVGHGWPAAGHCLSAAAAWWRHWIAEPAPAGRIAFV